jgi:hypothetical protein
MLVQEHDLLGDVAVVRLLNNQNLLKVFIKNVDIPLGVQIAYGYLFLFG